MEEIKEKITADIIVLLDTSASMNTMDDEPKESITTFLNEQKGDDIKVSFYTFNTKIQTIFEDKDLKDVGELSYHNAGLTAVFDAIGFSISRKLSTNRNKNVTLLIISDGKDNSSVEFPKSKVVKLTEKAKKEYNWNIIYLGSNLEAMNEVAQYGIVSSISSFDQDTPGNLLKMVKAASQVTINHRSKSLNPVNKNLTKNELISKSCI